MPRFYKIETHKDEVVRIVENAFCRYKQYIEMPHGQNLKHTYNFYWSWTKPKLTLNTLIIFQRINHFPKINVLTRKDNLYRTILKAKNRTKKCERMFDIVPMTFIIPKD